MEQTKRRTAFVTGGSRGIGRGIVRMLAEDGYDVAFTYYSEEGHARSLKEELDNAGVRGFYYQASLEKPGIAERVTEKAIQDLGGIDLLICNAGVTIHNDTLNLDPEDMDYLYNLNYRSYMMSAKIAANDMVKRGVKGNIIFIASTRGFRAYPDDSLYGGFKAALIRSIESMALDLAEHGIRVNGVAPGATAVRGNYTPEELREEEWTRRIPLGRKGSPDEVGRLVRFIASDAMAYMTGNTIKLDGGLILPGMPEE